MHGARSSIIYDEHLDQFKELELIDEEEDPNQNSENRMTGNFEASNNLDKLHSNSYQLSNESGLQTRMTTTHRKNQRNSANLVDPKYNMSVGVEISSTVD